MEYLDLLEEFNRVNELDLLLAKDEKLQYKDAMHNYQCESFTNYKEKVRLY